jgi:hypothetical protein
MSIQVGVSKHLYPTLTNLERCYLALRAGPISSDALRERLNGDTCTIYHLIRLKHAEICGEKPRRNESCSYRLTALGREACPSRRSVEQQIQLKYATGITKDCCA